MRSRLAATVHSVQSLNFFDKIHNDPLPKQLDSKHDLMIGGRGTRRLTLMTSELDPRVAMSLVLLNERSPDHHIAEFSPRSRGLWRGEGNWNRRKDLGRKKAHDEVSRKKRYMDNSIV